MAPAAGAFSAMLAPPSVLDNVQENARAVLRSGWRPPDADGPSRDELADRLTLSPLRSCGPSARAFDAGVQPLPRKPAISANRASLSPLPAKRSEWSPGCSK
jgi:hypothetical protein